MSSEKRKFLSNENQKAEKWNLPSMDSSKSGVFKHETKKPTGSSQRAGSNVIPTANEIEQWHKDAQEEGYQHGLQKAQQETAEMRKRLLELINFFEHPLQSLNEEVEQQLNLLAVTLAQQLVRREIRTEPGEMIALIRESVQMLPASSRQIRIHLNPEDAELVRTTLQVEKQEDEQSWKLVEDPMIERGGCEIKSDKSVINVTLENRLQALAASILGGERIEDQSEEDPK